MKRLIAFFTIVCYLLSVKSFASCLDEAVLKSPGSSESDWSAIALTVSGEAFDKTEYLEKLGKYVSEKYQDEAKLSSSKSTEWHRIAIALNLLGVDVTDFVGVNLLNDGVFYRENLGRQGLNGYIWALICLESVYANEPSDAINTKEEILKHILSKQNEDGGFALSGKKSSCDITAMAIYALSFYSDRTEVRNAIENAKEYLYSIQNEDGSFSDGDTPNSESTAQVIIAMSALGEDVSKSSMYSALLSFETPDGFSHLKGEGTNTIATYQARCAISAVKKKGHIYSNAVNYKVSDERPVENRDDATKIETETVSQIVDEIKETDSATENIEPSEKVTNPIVLIDEEQNSVSYILLATSALLIVAFGVILIYKRRKK